MKNNTRFTIFLSRFTQFFVWPRYKRKLKERQKKKKRKDKSRILGGVLSHDRFE